MAMIQRFEDIQAWQEASKLVRMIIQLQVKNYFPKILGCEIKFDELRYL